MTSKSDDPINELAAQADAAAQKALTVGQRIRWARERADLSQAELGKSLNVSGGAVAQWETDRTHPSARNLSAVAEFLKVSHEWLATGRSDPVIKQEKLPSGRTIEIKMEMTITAEGNPPPFLELMDVLRKLSDSGKEMASKAGGKASVQIVWGDGRIDI